MHHTLVKLKQMVVVACLLGMFILLGKVIVMNRLRQERLREEQAKVHQRKKQRKPIIVVGSSAAGCAAIKQMIAKKYKAPIVWITQQTEMPYDKTKIPLVVNGKKKKDELALLTEKDIPSNIKRLFGRSLVSLVPACNEVTLDDGTVVRYEKILLATGMSYQIPAYLQSRAKNVFCCATLSDATLLCKYSKKHSIKSAVVVGAGLRGCSIAKALADKGVRVLLIEKESHILGAYADKAGSDFIINHTARTKLPVTIMTGKKVVSIQPHDAVTTNVVLHDGQHIKTSLIVVATEKTPSTSYISSDTLVNKDGFFVVDKYFRTAIKNIYAAGDAIVISNKATGCIEPSYRWHDAVKQGKQAANAMMGLYVPYYGAMIAVKHSIFTMPFICCGQIEKIDAGDEVITYQGGKFYHRFVKNNGVLKGFLIIGTYKHYDLITLMQAIDKKIVVTERLLMSCHQSIFSSLAAKIHTATNRYV